MVCELSRFAGKKRRRKQKKERKGLATDLVLASRGRFQTGFPDRVCLWAKQGFISLLRV